MRVAIVHYWLVGMRGGERVLESLCRLYPQADIFTLVADPESISEELRRHKITTSFLQKLGGRKLYKNFLPIMPMALESFDVTDYDLVISSEAGPAKGIVPRPDALHVCYCHSPMRYIWDLEPQYRESSGRLKRLFIAATGPSLRQWDVTTSARVDYFIANSSYVADRIEKFYRRSSIVVHPPVNVARFSKRADGDDVYICAGQITPYKKIEVAVEAFNRMKKRLDVIGSGASRSLRAMAGPTIQFHGAISDQAMAERFARCRALIFPGVEDFGIVPLEVMASGRPVIAFARGGATETVIGGKTGILFDAQTPESLIAAVERFEALGIDGSPDDLIAHANQFSVQRFEAEMKTTLETMLEKWRTRRTGTPRD